MSTELASIREEFTSSIDELDRRIQRSEDNADRQLTYVNDGIDVLRSEFCERFEECMNRIDNH